MASPPLSQDQIAAEIALVAKNVGCFIKERDSFIDERVTILATQRGIVRADTPEANPEILEALRRLTPSKDQSPFGKMIHEAQWSDTGVFINQLTDIRRRSSTEFCALACEAQLRLEQLFELISVVRRSEAALRNSATSGATSWVSRTEEPAIGELIAKARVSGLYVLAEKLEKQTKIARSAA